MRKEKSLMRLQQQIVGEISSFLLCLLISFINQFLRSRKSQLWRVARWKQKGVACKVSIEKKMAGINLINSFLNRLLTSHDY